MNSQPDNPGKGSNVEIIQLEPQPVLSIRATIQIVQLGEAMGDRIQALSDYLRQRDIRPAGPPFVRYFTFGETETDFELGVPVKPGPGNSPLTGEGRIVSGELPGGSAVTTWHLGPHDKLGDAYARITDWITEHNREPDGPAREIYYWIDLGQDADSETSAVTDASTWRTQLVQPVK
jgi:effector-binding domain-containing protein